jgi:hypothetical protein
VVALRLRARGYRVFVGSVLAVGMAACLGGIFDPAPEAEGHGAWGWAAIAVLALLLWRSISIGVDVRNEAVLIRNWFGATSVPASHITEVAVRPYKGWMTRGSQYASLVCVTVSLADGRAATAWGLVGSRRATRRLADQLGSQLQVPVRSLGKYDV